MRDNLNTALYRALRALAHPLSVGAMLLLLANDHLLRWRWPSWWTGKAGDVAWLLFAPLAAAVLMALILPRRLPRRDAWAGALAIGLVGAVFALVKTVPAAHAAFCALLTAVLGRAPLLVRDPSDLLALPVLALSWRLWWAVGDAPLRIPRRAWPALALASLAIVADVAGPDYGVIELVEQDGQILSVGHYGRDSFASADGGLTWTRIADLPVEYEVPEARAWTYQVESTGDVYRFTPAQRIEGSTDGGRTWVTEVRLNGADARSVYYQATTHAASGLLPGPVDALYDPATGNLVVAMGGEGVLVRTPDGAWQWVAVGPYHFEPLQRPDQLVRLLQGELWLALAALFLGVSALGFGRQALWHRGVLLVLSLGWVALVLAGQPALRSGYDSFFTFLPTVALFVAALLFAIWGTVRHPRAQLGGAMAVSLGAALLFLVPYVLWGLGLIPRYAGAAWPAVLLVALALFGGYRLLRWTEVDD